MQSVYCKLFNFSISWIPPTIAFLCDCNALLYCPFCFVCFFFHAINWQYIPNVPDYMHFRSLQCIDCLCDWCVFWFCAVVLSHCPFSVTKHRLSSRRNMHNRERRCLNQHCTSILLLLKKKLYSYLSIITSGTVFHFRLMQVPYNLHSRKSLHFL